MNDDLSNCFSGDTELSGVISPNGGMVGNSGQPVVEWWSTDKVVSLR